MDGEINGLHEVQDERVESPQEQLQATQEAGAEVFGADALLMRCKSPRQQRARRR